MKEEIFKINAMSELSPRSHFFCKADGCV